MTIQVPDSPTPALLVMKGAFMRKLVLLMVLTLGATVAQADNARFISASAARAPS